MTWERGRSGNPSGRPRSASLVARAVADRTGGGAEIVERILAIARGEDKTIASERSRTWAWEWLGDRLWGRPAQSLELTSPDEPRAARVRFDDSALTTDELREIVAASATLERLTAKAAGGSRRPAGAIAAEPTGEAAPADAVRPVASEGDLEARAEHAVSTALAIARMTADSIDDTPPRPTVGRHPSAADGETVDARGAAPHLPHRGANVGITKDFRIGGPAPRIELLPSVDCEAP